MRYRCLHCAHLDAEWLCRETGRRRWPWWLACREISLCDELFDPESGEQEADPELVELWEELWEESR